MTMVILPNRILNMKKDVSRGSETSCSALLHDYFARCLRSSMPVDKGLTLILQSMHTPFAQVLYDCQRSVVIFPDATENPLHWPAFLHKLFVYHTIFRVALMPGNGALSKCLKEPCENYKKTIEIIMRMDCSMIVDKKYARQLLVSVTPRVRTVDSTILHNKAIMCLKNVDWYPRDLDEEREIDTIGTVLEKYVSREFPLDSILLMGHVQWEKRYSVWKELRQAMKDSDVHRWSSTISDLPDNLKRYVKFFLLSLTRHYQFQITYAFPAVHKRVKCSRNLQSLPLCERLCRQTSPCSDQGKYQQTLVDLSTVVTFCNFCKECLTYIDMSRRPPSFGHYTNVDTMRQFCHRDDSDRMTLLWCCQDNPYVNLTFCHPDRLPFGVCQGRRTCFELVAYPDMLCAFCFHEDLSDIYLHRATCLEVIGKRDEGVQPPRSGERAVEDMCTGCRYLLERDPNVITSLLQQTKDALIRESEAVVAAKHLQQQDQYSKSRKRTQRALNAMNMAIQHKERRKLLK